MKSLSRIWKEALIEGEISLQDFLTSAAAAAEKKIEEKEESSEEESAPSPAPEELAEAMLVEASEKSEAILAKAKEEAEEIRESSFQEGKNEGYQQGLREARESFEKRAEDILGRLDGCLQEVRDKFTAYEREYPRRITELALGIAGEIIKREVDLDPSVVVDVTKEALISLNGVEEVTIRVNWNDLELMRENKKLLLGSLEGLKRIEFVVDERLEPGGTVIECPRGGVDASLSSQLERIREGLMEVVEGE